jgi:hypothetical protein
MVQSDTSIWCFAVARLADKKHTEKIVMNKKNLNFRGIIIMESFCHYLLHCSFYIFRKSMTLTIQLIRFFEPKFFNLRMQGFNVLTF